MSIRIMLLVIITALLSTHLTAAQSTDRTGHASVKKSEAVAGNITMQADAKIQSETDLNLNVVADCNGNGVLDSEEISDDERYYWYNNFFKNIKIDLPRGKKYRFSGEDDIYRLNLDGSEREHWIDTTIPHNTTPTTSMVINSANETIYWTAGGESTIRYSDLSAYNPDASSVVISGRDLASTVLQIDPLNEKLYWYEQRHIIYRANLDGTNIELLHSAQGTLAGYRVDAINGKMYWCQTDNGTLHRANLDGSDAELIVDNTSCYWDMAIDSIRGKLYWASTPVLEMNSLYHNPIKAM